MLCVRASIGWFCLILSLGVGSAGCREQDYSGEPYPEDLGDGDRVLMPVPVRGYTSKPRFEGSAELRPLAQITADAAPGGGDNAGPIVAQVRELIGTYNDIVKEEAYEELPAYYVERQKETVTKLVDLHEQLKGKTDALLAAVKDKAPDSMPSAVKLRDLMALHNMEFKVSDLTEVSETEVTGKIVPPDGATTMPGMDLSVRFLLIEDEWYIEQPTLDMMAAMLPMMTQMMTQLDAITAGISSGQMDPATVAQQLQTFSAMLSGGQPRGEQPSVLDQGHDDKAPDEGGGEP